MAGLSSKGQAAVISALTQVQTAGANNAWVSLHTQDPLDAGSNEISTAATGYARQGAIAWSSTGSNPTLASNTAVITYPQATAAWGNIAFFGVWDALSAGNFRGSGPITTPKTVNQGDTARFAAGSLTIQSQ